jgi:DNA polymerase-1
MTMTRTQAPEIVVIDGTALLFRAYYGAPPAEAVDGTPIGGVLGTARTLVDMLGRARTSHVIVVFDAGQRTFRNTLDPAYKANRGAPPADLVPQFDLVQEMVRALGFATLCAPGFEADDLMATVARQAHREGWGTWLLSPDKDLYQLVNDAPPGVRVFHWHNRTVIDGAEVAARIGVAPSFAVDYFALVGDSSDNVRGVRGVGPKAASALVSSLGSLAQIYARLDDVATLEVRGAKSLRDKLEAGREAAELALKLVTLKDDVAMGVEGPLGPWARWLGPKEEAKDVFARLGVDGPLQAMRTIHASRSRG